MTRKTVVLTGTFLSVTAAAVGMEVWFAVDNDPETLPWTTLLVRYVPAPITYAAIAVLTSFLMPHFIEAYAKRRSKTMDTTTIPATPEPGAEKEPLVSRALITAVASEAIALAVAFGVPLTDDQRYALLGLLVGGSTLFAALWARRTAWAPATVRASVITAARTGQVPTEPVTVPAEPTPAREQP